MEKTEFAARLQHACSCVISAETELTQIDSRFGDGSHGLAMVRICQAISQAVTRSGGGIHAMLGYASASLMTVYGGAFVPIWSSCLDGFRQYAPEEGPLTPQALKEMFSGALTGFYRVSQAKAGEKTMLDVLLPVQKAVNACNGTCSDILLAAARAAEVGAESTRNYVAKFGPAAAYGLQTLGTPDAGALSLSIFLGGMAGL